MSDITTRYELPAGGITLLGYVVRRMHKTHLLASVPSLLAMQKTGEALAQVALYSVACATSYGRAYYQPEFNRPGAEVTETDPQTGAIVRAKLEATSPAYHITYYVTLTNGDLFTGSEKITGTTVGLRGLGMPAPTQFHFASGDYQAELTGILVSELALSLIGRTRIRAYGSLNFSDNSGNTGKLNVDRNQNLEMMINEKVFIPAVKLSDLSPDVQRGGRSA